MKKLTLYPRMADVNLDMLEETYKAELPQTFREFMKENAGLSHYERFFNDNEGRTWEVFTYLNFIEIYELADEFSENLKSKIIPFAFDPGGWHYCLSLDENDFGSIWVNRWTDHLPENQLLRICEDFELFINNLYSEE